MVRGLEILLFNLVLTALLLATAEWGSRRLVPTPLPQPLIADQFENWVGRREFHPVLFWRMTPRLDARGRTVINELGLRGPLPGPKEPGEFRILSLGESTTAGLRLPLAETYSGVLERVLGSKEKRPIEVVNGGTGGYTLAQGVELVRLHGLSLEPDLILTYFGYNDFLRVHFRSSRDSLFSAEAPELTDLELIRRRRRPWTKVKLWLQQHSNLARYFSQRQTLPAARPGRKRRVPERDRVVLYRELRHLCEKAGIRLVVLVPIYRSFHRHERFLRELGSKQGFEVIDLPSILAVEPDAGRSLFLDDLHPTSELHESIGLVIAEHLGAL